MTFHCPSPDEVLTSVLALLPRGRAWQTHEGYPRNEAVPGFNPDAFNDDGFSTQTEEKSVLRQYWASFSVVAMFATQRICDLRLEFWCATHSETHDRWMTEYGLPDLCDPFPELCAKVAAIGGTRCEYYQFIAERAGWRLQCFDGRNLCGARAGSGRAKAGCCTPGRPQSAGFLTVVVDIGNSPAISSTFRDKTPKAGRFRAGRRMTCFVELADLAPLECLLARVVHAEVQIVYEVLPTVEPGVPGVEPPEPPSNLSLLVDLDGAYVVDTDGQNIMVEPT